MSTDNDRQLRYYNNFKTKLVLAELAAAAEWKTLSMPTGVNSPWKLSPRILSHVLDHLIRQIDAFSVVHG